MHVHSHLRAKPPFGQTIWMQNFLPLLQDVKQAGRSVSIIKGMGREICIIWPCGTQLTHSWITVSSDTPRTYTIACKPGGGDDNVLQIFSLTFLEVDGTRGIEA